MDDLLKLLVAILLSYQILIIFRHFKKIKGLYESLGAEVKSYIMLKASFNVKGKKFNISSFKRYLTISTPSPVSGYLSIRKEFGRGFNIYYDDEDWANLVLKTSKLKSLIDIEKLPRLSCVEINGNIIKLEFFKRKIDEELKENIKTAIELLIDVIPSLEGLPASPVGVEKNKLRNQVLYYIPLGIFLFLGTLGIYWKVNGYGDPLCEDDIFVLGFKVLTPIFIAHFLLVILLLGKHIHLKANILPLLIIYFAGYYLIPQIILAPFNARFDSSQPVQVETKVIKKYHAYRGGFRVVLENTGCSFRVSERLYKRVVVGNTMVLYIKDGAFGVRWAYRYWLKE